MFNPPKKSVLIRTRLSPEEVRNRLTCAIGNPRGFNFLAPRPEPYIGILKDDRFIIRKKGLVKDPYRPSISGNIMGGDEGTQIHLILQPPIRWLVSLILSIIFIAIAVLIWFDLGVDIVNGEVITILRVAISAIATVGLIALSIITTKGTLIRQYERTTEFFCTLLESRIIQESLIE